MSINPDAAEREAVLKSAQHTQAALKHSLPCSFTSFFFRSAEIRVRINRELSGNSSIPVKRPFVVQDGGRTGHARIQQQACWIQYPAECTGSSKIYTPAYM